MEDKKKEFKVSTLHKFDNDKYYTPDETIEECMELLKETVNIDEVDVVIEPSAGSGAFIPYIEKMFPNAEKIYLDLIPEKEGIKHQDYLEFSYNNNGKKVLTLGNPPYGGDGRSLYRRFYERSCLFSEYIAFILPSNILMHPEYLYEFDLIKAHHLGMVEYYNLEGKSKPVNTAFLIFKRPNNPLGALNREKDILKDYLDYRIVPYNRGSHDKPRSNPENFKKYGSGIVAWGTNLFRTDTVDSHANIMYIDTHRDDIREYFLNFDWHNYYIDNYKKYVNSAPRITRKMVQEVIENRFDDLK